MNTPRDTIPFAIGATVDRSDGLAVVIDDRDGRCQATYALDGHNVAVAYIDDAGNPRVDFQPADHVGLGEFKRLLVVWVQAWAHAQALSALWRGGSHAG